MEPTLRTRMRDGDPDAFGALFDEFARPVHNLACRLTGNRTEAEEIVSLTFLEAWRLRAGIEPEGPPARVRSACWPKSRPRPDTSPRRR